jgi:hypothetical protein
MRHKAFLDHLAKCDGLELTTTVFFQLMPRDAEELAALFTTAERRPNPEPDEPIPAPLPPPPPEPEPRPPVPETA